MSGVIICLRLARTVLDFRVYLSILVVRENGIQSLGLVGTHSYVRLLTQ